MAATPSIPRFCKPKGNNIDIPTRFLYVSGVGDLLNTESSILKYVFSEYGSLEAPFIEMVPGKSFCFIIYHQMESAILAKESLQDKVIEQLGNTKLFIKYAQESIPPQSSPEPEESVSSDIVLDSNPQNSMYHVPGLLVLENFISEDEEKNLIEGLCAVDRPWETLLNRNVQHYGFEFNYRTLLLDYTKDTPPLPSDSCLQSILTRIQQSADDIVKHQNGQTLSDSPTMSETSNSIVGNNSISSNELIFTNTLPSLTASASTSSSSLLGTYPLNQLTMNEYMPGQGIAHHVDSPTCFGPVICILSTAADISMTFVAKKPGSVCGGGGGINSSSTLNSTSSDNNSNDDKSINSLTDSVISAASSSATVDTTGSGHTVHMYVRRRSLMIFTQASRYTYTHGIASRRTDKFQGVTIERQRRVSLTFRQAIVPGAVPSSHLAPSQLEKTHVHEIYDAIATHWHHTRGKRKVHWHSVKAFLLSLPKGCLVADVGCGDGKYFNVNPDITVIGCDRSDTLLQVSKDCYTSASTPNVTQKASSATTVVATTTASLDTAPASKTKIKSIKPQSPSSAIDVASKAVDDTSVVNTNSVADTFCCDAVMIPLMSDTFDATLCIAVLHHISTLDRRLAVIRELLRITKPGGEVLLQAWALEQDLDTLNIDMAASSSSNDTSNSRSSSNFESFFSSSSVVVDTGESNEKKLNESTRTQFVSSAVDKLSSSKVTSKVTSTTPLQQQQEVSSQLSANQQKHQVQQQQRRFDFQSAAGDQDLFVPWSLPQRFAGSKNTSSSSITTTGVGSSDENVSSVIIPGDEEAANTGNNINNTLLNKKNTKDYQRVSRQPAKPKVYEFSDTDTAEERAAKERRQVEEKRKVRGIEKRERVAAKKLKQQQLTSATSNSINTTATSSSDVILEPLDDMNTETSLDDLNITDNKETSTTSSATIATASATSKPRTGSRSLKTDIETSSSTTAVEQKNPNQVLHRYCHVYKQGELEDLCSSVPNCRLIASGYDKGNWFVRLQRVNDTRLLNAYVAPPAPAPVITHRGVLHRRQYPHHEKKNGSVNNSSSNCKTSNGSDSSASSSSANNDSSANTNGFIIE